MVGAFNVGASSKPSVVSRPSEATSISLPPAASPDSSANVGSIGKTSIFSSPPVATFNSSATVATSISSVPSVAGVNVGTSGNKESEDVVTGAEAV